MGKNIIIAGNFAAGKTTLAKAICERTGYIPFWEEPEKRPFQVRFTTDLVRWSLANQIDFFTYRAQQELAIKQHTAPCIQDGSLDQDMRVFTQHLFNQGILDAVEFNLCKQVYDTYRELLGSPDLIIKINASITTIMDRRIARARGSDEKLVKQHELEVLETLLTAWIGNVDNIPLLEFDADDTNFPHPLKLTTLIEEMESILSK